ncbi:MAG: VOC family protein [Flavobacteriaceae bacterium]|nr:VOC family protein [Flavobacteriaceae bacterium]
MKKQKFNKILILFSVGLLIGLVACHQASQHENMKPNVEKQSFALYNHSALVVKNVDASVQFYHYVFGFDTIHYPFPYRENIKAKWMSTGNGCELHLGELKGDTTHYFYPGHIGFTVTNIDTVLARLEQLKYPQPELDKMPNGERTFQMADIDGNNIHIIERKK